MDLHYIQREILRELLFNPDTNFTKLNTHGITSDHFSYHIKQLIKIELVEKRSGKYVLSDIGKDLANRLDTESETAVFEKFGKVGVFCLIFSGSDYNSKMIAQTRLKEPFFGYKGVVTGKIKFGETTFDAARREVLEETGLVGELNYKGMAHHVNIKDGRVVEDKYFFCFVVLNAKGELLYAGEGFKNELMTISQLRKQKPLYNGELDIIDMCIGKKKVHMIEEVYQIDEF
jgi:ADP-ribose pyrophosphatase YjhB (NUDIX family)